MNVGKSWHSALGCLIPREALAWGNLPQRLPGMLIPSVCHQV